MNELIYVGWDDGTSLYHYGIAGQKWGQRRFQNQDGSLTAEGRQRYGIGERLYGKGRFGAGGYVSDATRNSKKGSDAYKANKEFDKKIESYYNKASKGKNFVKDMLLGTSGTMTYNMARSLGESRGKAFIRSVFDINVGRLSGTVVNQGISGGLGAITKNKSNQALGRGDYSGAMKGALKGNFATNLAGTVAGKAAERAFRNSGAELSLQQRALRRKATRKK